ncbi:MAG: aminomethyl-transferring glycine dehydrogenase subunit GcvPA [Eubacteriales bacterium]
MGGYTPVTDNEKREMLDKIGASGVSDLFCAIPEEVKIDSLNIPEGKSELEVLCDMERLAAKNKVFASVFRGAGAYHHFIPPLVRSIVAKEEFLTAYTPYQAEISQGLLQGIFEFQTMICELTGMDVSNASVYDGATATAEAVTMCRDKKRTKIILSAALHPMTVATVQTYCGDCEIVTAPVRDGKTDLTALRRLVGEDTACVCVQQPNFYGMIEDADAIGEAVHSAGAKFIMAVNPIAAAILTPPGDCGADIAVGEGQPLGMPLSFGGPYLGFMACTDAMMRKLPGRIVGETLDRNGKRAFVLTMQAREQHIRREKASSNICSNQALCALTASVYLSCMGASGLQKTAELCVSKAHYAAEQLCSVKGFTLKHTGEFFHEFVTVCPVDANILLHQLEERDILGGYRLSEREILWCVTEMNSKEQINALVAAVKEVCLSETDF